MLFRSVRELSTNYVTLERERKERAGVETLIHGKSPRDFSSSKLQEQGYKNFVIREKNLKKVLASRKPDSAGRLLPLQLHIYLLNG